MGRKFEMKLVCIAPINGFEPGPHARAMKDPAQNRLLEFAARASNGTEMVDLLFSKGNIFSPELASFSGFTSRIAEYLDLVITSGIKPAAELALSRSGRL